MEMRDYMPREHRAFIEVLEQGPSVRDYVITHRTEQPTLRDAYNACIHWITEFRQTFGIRCALYSSAEPGDVNNPTTVGTGGTPFMPYLKKHRDETLDHLIA